MSGKLPVRAYPSAGGVVDDAQVERVLTLQRPGRTGPDGRMEVRLPKGHIEAGESREQTAIREVHEEAGLSGLKVLADLGESILYTADADRQAAYVLDSNLARIVRVKIGHAVEATCPLP